MMPKPYVHVPLLYESIAFLALKCLPLPPGFFDTVARSGARLTLAT